MSTIAYYDPGSYHSVKKIDENHFYCTLCRKLIKLDEFWIKLSTIEGMITKHIASKKHCESYKEWIEYNHNLVAYINSLEHGKS